MRSPDVARPDESGPACVEQVRRARRRARSRWPPAGPACDRGWCAEKPFLDQEGLDHVLERVARLGERGGQRLDPDRPAVVILGDARAGSGGRCASSPSSSTSSRGQRRVGDRAVDRPWPPGPRRSRAPGAAAGRRRAACRASGARSRRRRPRSSAKPSCRRRGATMARAPRGCRTPAAAECRSGRAAASPAGPRAWWRRSA